MNTYLKITGLHMEGSWEDGTPFAHNKEIIPVYLQKGDTLDIEYKISFKMPKDGNFSRAIEKGLNTFRLAKNGEITQLLC